MFERPAISPALVPGTLTPWETPSDDVRIERLIDHLSRSPRYNEVHVREQTTWTWTRYSPDPDDTGVRYSKRAVITVIDSSASSGLEIEVASRILDRDQVTHYVLNEGVAYRILAPIAAALR